MSIKFFFLKKKPIRSVFRQYFTLIDNIYISDYIDDLINTCFSKKNLDYSKDTR